MGLGNVYQGFKNPWLRCGAPLGHRGEGDVVRERIPGVQEPLAKMRCPVGAQRRRRDGQISSPLELGDRLFSTPLEHAE